MSFRSASTSIPVAAFPRASTWINRCLCYILRCLCLLSLVRYIRSVKLFETWHDDIMDNMYCSIIQCYMQHHLYLNKILRFTSRAVKSLWSSMCHGYSTDNWNEKAMIPTVIPIKGRFSNRNKFFDIQFVADVSGVFAKDRNLILYFIVADSEDLWDFILVEVRGRGR